MLVDSPLRNCFSPSSPIHHSLKHPVVAAAAAGGQLALGVATRQKRRARFTNNPRYPNTVCRFCSILAHRHLPPWRRSLHATTPASVCLLVRADLVWTAPEYHPSTRLIPDPGQGKEPKKKATERFHSTPTLQLCRYYPLSTLVTDCQHTQQSRTSMH